MSVFAGPEINESGLVLYLDAGNIKSYTGSGTSWTDISGRGNTGTLTNGPTYSSANGGSIVFDGTNDYVIVGNNPPSSTLNIVDNVSLSIWIKFPTGYGNATYNSIIVKRRPGNQVNYGLGYNPTGGVNVLYWYYSNFVGGASVPLTSNFSENVWTNICGTFSKNGSTTDSVLYKDGVALISSNGAGNVAAQASPDVTIGGYVYAGIEYSPVTISNVSIYNRTLSAAEVSQNFNATRSRYGI